MKFSTLFFDLDDTLYPPACGLWPDIKARIGLYMRDCLHIPEAQISPLRQRYHEEYGTVLRGLQREYPIPADDFLAYVHDLPLERYLQPRPDLAAALQNLPARKMILTNADSAHANRVLRVLGLETCFERVIDINALAPYCKPMPQALQIALRLAGETDPGRCALFDDMPRTTRAARQAGFFSVLVRPTPPEDPACASAWLSGCDQLHTLSL